MAAKQPVRIIIKSCMRVYAGDFSLSANNQAMSFPC